MASGNVRGMASGMNRATAYLAVALIMAVSASGCIMHTTTHMADNFLKKTIKKDVFENMLVEESTGDMLLFSLFRLTTDEPLNNVLETMMRDNGCKALANIEVRTHSMTYLVVSMRRTNVYARCVGVKEKAAAKPAKEKPAEEPEAEEEE